MLLNRHGNKGRQGRRQLEREHFTWNGECNNLLGVWLTEDFQNMTYSNEKFRNISTTYVKLKKKRRSRNNLATPILNAIEDMNLPNSVNQDDEDGSYIDARKYCVSGYGSVPMSTVIGKPVVNTGNKPLYTPSSLETIYFRDGKRKIDYVLAYEEGSMSSIADENKLEKRDVFLENLIEQGLELEKEDKALSQDGKTFFIKIYAPWSVLTQYAEIMSLKMPIKAVDEVIEKPNQDCSCSTSPFDYDKNLIPDDPPYFTSAFNRQRESQFVISNKETFFTSAQRSRMVWQILTRTHYSLDDMSKIGVMRLLNNGTFKAAFPLHEPQKAEIPHLSTSSLNADPLVMESKYQMRMRAMFEGAYTRTLLYQEWARWGCWYKKQPLQLIRKYFGVKIGIYFAWLGFYTSMLIPPAIVGVLCFLYGVFTLSSSIPVNDICNDKGPGNFTICPLCDKSCRFKRLHESCFFAQVSYIFDNPATVFFRFLWLFGVTTTFLEFWKRRQARIVWEWDLGNYDEEEETTRPEFELQVKTKRINPATKNLEPFMPFWNKALRVAAASSAVLLMVAVVLATVFGVVVYRIATATALHSSTAEFIRENAKITVSVTSALINLTIILILDRVYQKIAIILTNLERPRTQTEYENSFTFKMFLFQSVNFYSSLIYIAFFKGSLFLLSFVSLSHTLSHGIKQTSSPVDINLLLLQCDPAGCLFELCVQLSIIMVGKQVLNNLKEILFPLVVNWWAARKSKANTKQLYTRWEKDYDLRPTDNLTLFYEYLEMVIQYGFITIFVASFPLAPLFALLNNVAEIRIDAFKFVTQVRRPMAARANSIGAWAQILQMISTIAVLVNAFVIAYTSSFIPEMVYRYNSGNFSLNGYINDVLAVYNTSDFSAEVRPMDMTLDGHYVELCRYRDYRIAPPHPHKYERSIEYWHVFAARLAFVVTFEHLVFVLTSLLAYVIPDAPFDVRTNLRREKILGKEALYDAELQKLRNENVNQLKRQSRSVPNLLEKSSWEPIKE
uniref:Anoctamin n=1 Tax=Strigamia maritima TaxID=126957 RepID=T1J757_STRMM